MKPITLQNFAEGKWVPGSGGLAELRSAIDGEVVALTSSQGLDFAAMLKHAREEGGPTLRALTFHQRALMLKALADALTAKKEALYELSYNTGATKADSWIDIDGGIGTFAVYQGKGRRELPNERILIDGNVEALSRNGTFQGLHVFTSLQGVAVHINAFNFPVWGMLEKLAPTFLAGVPAIVKPASTTSYLTEAAVRIMLDANMLPKGALQLIVGSTGDLFEHLTTQDVVSFTGSAATANRLKAHPVVVRESVRFVAEQDSLSLGARPRCEGGLAGVRSFHQRGRQGNDGEGGPKVHRHPPRYGPGFAARRYASRARRALGKDHHRRSARRSHAHGRARQHQSAQRRTRQDQRDQRGCEDRLWRSGRFTVQREGRLHLARAASLRESVASARRA